MKEKNSKNADLNQLPLYQCHKRVQAIKIKRIYRTYYGARLIPEDSNYVPVFVSHDYIKKYSPKIGGYFVRYYGGYEAYSPAKAFEEGYSLINN
jgi:hypothetical protein